MGHPFMQTFNLSVGEVAARSGVAISALHFYEQKGLITSVRNHGNQRRYSKDILRRVAVIKAAQKVGLTLNEIERAFAQLPKQRTPNKNDWEKLSKSWRSTLNERIQRLENLRDKLTSCIGCGCLSLQACPLYNKDDELAIQGPGAVLLDRIKT